MAYVSVKDIFPFFGSNTLGQKELSEYNLTRSIRCLNTGNNAFATSASNTPFNLTTTASPITPGSSTIEFTLGEGEGEIGGYYVKIENTQSIKLSGNWQAKGIFYLHLNMSSRGLKYASNYATSETAVELKYASSGEIPLGEREYSLKIAELVESSDKLIVTYSCHRGLINNIDLTYGSMMRERFLRDGIYYYLNQAESDEENIKLSKNGIEVKKIDSIKTTEINSITVSSINNTILTAGGTIVVNNNNKNKITLSEGSGITIDTPYVVINRNGNQIIELDSDIILGNQSNGMTLTGHTINIQTTGKIGITGGTGIDIINGQQKILLDASNVTIQSNTTNGTTTLNGWKTFLNGNYTEIKSTTQTHIGSNTRSILATNNGSYVLSIVDVLKDNVKIKSGSDTGAIGFYIGGDHSIDQEIAYVDKDGLNSNKGLYIEEAANMDGTLSVVGAVSMGNTLDVTGKITAKKQISASNVIHSDSNVTANGNVTAKGNVTANNGNDILGSGTLKLNNVAMVDFVVEEGVKTVEGFTWKFRKWKNGRYEAWATDTFDATFTPTTKQIWQPSYARTVYFPHYVAPPTAPTHITKYFNASLETENPSCSCMGASITYNDRQAFVKPWKIDTTLTTESKLTFCYYVVYE